jgi:hypothetical protein
VCKNFRANSETKHCYSTNTTFIIKLTWVKGLSDLIIMADVPKTHFSVLLWRIKRFKWIKLCLTLELNIWKCFLFSELYRMHSL